MPIRACSTRMRRASFPSTRARHPRSHVSATTRRPGPSARTSSRLEGSPTTAAGPGREPPGRTRPRASWRVATVSVKGSMPAVVGARRAATTAVSLSRTLIRPTTRAMPAPGSTSKQTHRRRRRHLPQTRRVADEGRRQGQGIRTPGSAVEERRPGNHEGARAGHAFDPESAHEVTSRHGERGQVVMAEEPSRRPEALENRAAGMGHAERSRRADRRPTPPCRRPARSGSSISCPVAIRTRTRATSAPWGTSTASESHEARRTSVTATTGVGRKRGLPASTRRSKVSPRPKRSPCVVSDDDGTWSQRTPAATSLSGSLRKKAPGNAPYGVMSSRSARGPRGARGS